MYAMANMGHPSREEGFVLCSNFGAAGVHDHTYSGPSQAALISGTRLPHSRLANKQRLAVISEVS